MRQLKRDIKQAGNKHRRRQFKRSLADDPENAHHAEEDLGRHRSAGLNALDQDASRRKPWPVHGEPPLQDQPPSQDEPPA